MHLVDEAGRFESPTPSRSSTGICGGACRISWDLVRPKPYSLLFRNSSDVICLLFGAIEARTGYDGARPNDMRFEPLSIAFHPCNGEVAVSASRVSGGFVAYSFPPAFRDSMFGDDAVVTGATRSVDNIISPTIANLVTYARSAIVRDDGADSLSIESLGHLAYVEAMRGMRSLKARVQNRALSNRQATRLVDYIEENLAAPLSIADLAKVVGLPIATLRHQFQQHTGQTIHQYIIERRLQLACKLLMTPQASIPDIAASSGFSSQQHMTMAFRNRLGTTPRGFQRARLES